MHSYPFSWGQTCFSFFCGVTFTFLSFTFLFFPFLSFSSLFPFVFSPHPSPLLSSFPPEGSSCSFLRRLLHMSQASRMCYSLASTSSRRQPHTHPPPLCLSLVVGMSEDKKRQRKTATANNKIKTTTAVQEKEEVTSQTYTIPRRRKKIIALASGNESLRYRFVPSTLPTRPPLSLSLSCQPRLYYLFFT